VDSNTKECHILELKYNSYITSQFSANGRLSYAPNAGIKYGQKFKYNWYYDESNNFTNKFINTENFLNNNDANHEKIIFVYFKEYILGPNFFNTLFYGCPNVEQAFFTVCI